MKFRSNRQLEQSTNFLEQKIVQFDESGGGDGIDRLRENQTSIIDNNNNHLQSSRSSSVQSMSKKNGLGVSGLSNLGNTCFFNSVLQVKTRIILKILFYNCENFYFFFLPPKESISNTTLNRAAERKPRRCLAISNSHQTQSGLRLGSHWLWRVADCREAEWLAREKVANEATSVCAGERAQSWSEGRTGPAHETPARCD